MRQYPKIIRTLCCTHRKGNFCPCGDARSITRYDAGLPHARQNFAKIDEINAKNRDTKQTKPIVDLAESGIHKRLANECWDMNTQKTMEWYDPMSFKNIFHVCIMNIRHCMFFFSPHLFPRLSVALTVLLGSLEAHDMARRARRAKT